MEIIRDQISLDRLLAMAGERFGDLVKAVVDVERGIMAVDAGMHADEEAVLLEDGSKQAELWGINLYPNDYGDPAWLEFDSMINLRPGQGNRTRSVDDEAIRANIADVIGKLVLP
ncbi:MAG: DUF5674 family protein [Chloroflexota bacterium]